MVQMIVLASTSRYRRDLLARLHLPFEVIAPTVDEAALPGEAVPTTALRLAQAKAADVLVRRPEAIVIGADQIAELDGQPINKPGDHATALAQLQSLQGRRVVFHTAVAVAQRGRAVLLDDVRTTVVFRRLPMAALDAYLRADQAYDCAGSAKVESLGIALLERVESDDPTALIGLPLIRLTTMLEACGVAVLPGGATAIGA